MKPPPSQPTVIVQWEPLLSNINLNPDEMQAHKAAPPNTPIIRSTVVRCLKYVCKWTTEKKTGESNLINLVDVRMWHCYALLDFIVPAFEKSQSCFPCFFPAVTIKERPVAMACNHNPGGILQEWNCPHTSWGMYQYLIGMAHRWHPETWPCWRHDWFSPSPLSGRISSKPSP